MLLHQKVSTRSLLETKNAHASVPEARAAVDQAGSGNLLTITGQRVCSSNCRPSNDPRETQLLFNSTAANKSVVGHPGFEEPDELNAISAANRLNWATGSEGFVRYSWCVTEMLRQWTRFQGTFPPSSSRGRKRYVAFPIFVVSNQRKHNGFPLSSGTRSDRSHIRARR